MRRTKAEAALTRAAIVEGALECFDRYGITHTTVEQIACAAGVTRGAVYHHFEGKTDILRAIRDQVSLPFLDQADTALLKRGDLSALARVEQFLLGMLDGLENDPRKRLALTVMQFRCEYVGDMATELETATRNVDRLAKAFQAAYEEAHAAGDLARGLAPEIVALETVMFMNGLMRLWLIHGARAGLRKNARAAIEAHVASRRASSHAL